MSLNIIEDNNHVLGRKYNVEYLDGRGQYCTFSNVLVNVDGTYFWFESKQDGLALVKQDRVIFMYCTDKLKHNNGNSNFVYTITYNGETENELCNVINKVIAVHNNLCTIQIYVPAQEQKLFELQIVKDKTKLCKDIELVKYKGCSVIYDN